MDILAEYEELRRRDEQERKRLDDEWLAQIWADREGVPRERWKTPPSPPSYVLPELEAFICGPKYDLWCKAILKKSKQKSLNYIITFTWNQRLPKESFKHAVVKQLNRTIFSKVTYVFEHEDTNIHCHAYVTATHTLNKENFKSHAEKFGFVDVKHSSKDNGIMDYISKENTPIILK